MHESRGVWLEHLQRVMEHSEARQAQLSSEDYREIARELGIGDADLEAAHDAAEAHRQRGQGYLDNAMWSDAIGELEQAMALHPERVEIVTLRARAHLRRHLAEEDDDDAAQARRCARFALQQDPDDETAFAVLAELDRTDRERARRRGRRTLLVVGTCLVAGIVAAIVIAGRGEPEPKATASAEQEGPARVSPSTPTPGTSTTQRRTDPGCPPGMVFAPDQGCFAPSVVMEPGVGVLGIRLGQSTAQEVLDILGHDAKLDRYDDGEIFSINYLYDEDEKYHPRRTANLSRPSQVRLSDGVVTRISAGADSKALRTPGGLNTSSSMLEEVRAEFGDHYVLEHGQVLDIYRYENEGIEVWVHRESGRVNSIHLVPKGG